jgi:L-malate glycosyltransferase
VIEQESYPADKIAVIHNGIYIEPCATDMSNRNFKRSEMGAEDNSILIGSVGNIRPVKGYDILVDAAAIICLKNPNVQFFHAGEGEMREQLEARCRELGIGDRFHFLGATKDVPCFLSALDIYVQPSRSEGMSNAILEAMVARLPVVATNVGGNPDLIENDVTGLLVPGEDSSALAEQLLQLVRQPLMRNSLADRAYSRVHEKFHVSFMVENYKKKYLEIVKNDRAPETCY